MLKSGLLLLGRAASRNTPKSVRILHIKLENNFEVASLIRPLINSNIPMLINTHNYSTKKSKEKEKGRAIQKPKVELRIDEINNVINSNDLLKSMNDAIEHLKQDFNDNLNLRLTPSSFEQITIKTKEGPMKLGEIVQVEEKSANMFLIDLINSPDYVKPVLDAISKANLNINPQLDKTTIYLPIAKVTREHRENLSKSAKLKCEQAIKKMRDAENKALRKAKDAKNVSKDLVFNVSQWVKYQFELHQKEAHHIRDAKIKELVQE